MPAQLFSSQKGNTVVRPLSRVSPSPQRRNQGCSSQVVAALNALYGVVQLLVRLYGGYVGWTPERDEIPRI